MKMRKRLAGLALGSLVLGLAGMAQANLTVYHNQASFLAQAGSTTLYDFESDAPAFINPPGWGSGNPAHVRDFGAFRIDATSSGIYQSEIRNNNGITNDIYTNTYSNAASLKVIFDRDVTAFGFTYVAEGNNTWDHSTFSLDGTTWDLGTPGATGFFGLIEDSGTIAAGTAFSFGQDSSNWSGVSFDNLRYSAGSPATAPVPGAGLLTLAGLGIVGAWRRHTRS